MLLTEREIRVLEFNNIRNMLKENCVTNMGIEMAELMLPSEYRDEVERLLAETGEACSLLEMGILALDGIPDIRPLLDRVKKGSVLSPVELWQVMGFMDGCRKSRRMLTNDKINQVGELLYSYLELIDGSPDLLEKMKKCVSPEGGILDSASPLLQNTRRHINNTIRSVKDKLDSYIKTPSSRRYLQEALVTIRNDRYVIPVKMEYKGQIPGIVHDQSSSGATLFVEPFAVADLQNKMQEYRRQEEREVERILRDLSSFIESRVTSLEGDVQIYGILDFIVARGRLALSMSAVKPKLVNNSFLSLIGARHPLLGKEAVPIDIIIGGSYKVMIITGPNTGGKTVTLKTAGLLTAMVQSGLFIPVLSSSKMGVFKRIRADIGDEQSLEQSLSTFSGHMKNVISIIEESNEQSLIFLDELGAGTDPSEGAALARSVLVELYNRGALVAATTHINDLKVFAYLQDGIENASLEFDANTLAPTYRLITGVPGSSNALEIAGRLGLSSDILNRAKVYLSGEHVEMEKVIGSLNEERLKMREEAMLAARDRKEAEAVKAEARIERDLQLRKREEIIGKARDEARSVLKVARRSADESFRKLNSIISEISEQKITPSQAVKEAGAVRQDINIVREVVDEIPFKETLTPVEPGQLNLSDDVWLINLEQKGTVIQIMPGSNDVQVQVGDLKVNTRLNNLAMVENKDKKQKQQVNRTYTYRGSAVDVGTELHVRGMLLEEALEKAEQYLDRVVLTGLNKVFLVHGKGTGTLRRGLHDLLSNHPSVIEYRLGYPHEGGSGVTLVTLKK